MKKSLLTLEDVMLHSSGGIGFEKFSMEIHQGDVYGILCDSIDERDMLFAFFSNKCEVSGGKITYQHKKVSFRELAGNFHSDLTVIGATSKLIASVPIAENICLKKNLGWVLRKTCEVKAATYLERYHLKLNFKLSQMPRELTEKERVQVELLRALAEEKKLIILKDLSSFLNDLELSEIHQVMKQMKRTTFVLIEPLGQLVFDWSNRLLVTRDWVVNGCFNTNLVDREKLFSYLSVGQKQKEYHVKTEKVNETILLLDRIKTLSLQNVTLHVRKGEILTICCLDDKSLTGIRRMLFGEEELLSGSAVYEGGDLHFLASDKLRKKGIAYIPAVPWKTMLLKNMNVCDNLMLDLSRKLPLLWLKPRYRRSIEKKLNEELQQDISEYRITDLTGVLKQRLAYTKVLSSAPKVVFCERPFYNVDLHMREVTLEALKEFRQRKIGVVVLLRNARDLELLEGNVVYLRDGQMIERRI